MPKIVDHAFRRAEIRAAAAEAIAEGGLDRVRLIDVARRAGCTTGAVGHYFSGKEAVLAAALEHVLDNLVSSALGCLEMASGDDPAARLLEALSEVLPLDEPRRRDWRVWLAFCGRAANAPALAALHREAYAEIQRGLAEVVHGQGLAQRPADAVAVALMAGIDGVGLRATLEPELWPARRQREIVELQLMPLLKALAPAGARPSTPDAPDLETP